jgi:VanZ like family
MEPSGGGGNIGCLICGERGLADAIVNVILFMPLGAAAALAGRSTLVALAIGAALSGSVEFAQMTLIPGRDASVGDLVFNTLGAAAGVAIVKTSCWWLGDDRMRASRLSLAAAFLATGIIASTGLLLVPDMPEGTYFVMWKPVLRHLDPYDAPVRSVTIGGHSFPPGRIEKPTQVRELLRAGAPIRVVAGVAAKTSRQAAMFAIYDDLKREVVLIGPDRDDLVFRVRMRSASARLDQPDIRVVGGWRDPVPGSEITVTARRSGRNYCVGVGPQPHCSGGFSAGTGWALFFHMEHWPPLLQSGLNIFWLGMLAFPVGFWARRRWESLCALAVLAASVVVLPGWVGLLPTPAHQVLGGIAGFGVGAVLARVMVVNPTARARRGREATLSAPAA